MPTILLVVDAYSPLDRLLPAAVFLASQRNAQLMGVFVQDGRLVRGVALSCTQEIGAHSAVCYQVTSQSIEKRMRRIADEMRRRLSLAAERQHLRWDFQQCYGSISQIATATDAEIVVPGWSESLWAGAAHSCASTRKTPDGHVVVVIDDGSSSSAQVIEAARRLTKATGSHHLTVFAMDEALETRTVRHNVAADPKLAETRIPVDSIEQLIRQLRLLRPTLTLLGRDQLVSTDSRLHKTLASMKCPLALVRTTR